MMKHKLALYGKEEVIFLGFGVDNEENCGSWTAAIIQYPDGRLKCVDINDVKFVNPITPAEIGEQAILGK